MTSPIPTSPALTAMVSGFLRTLPPAYWALAQHHVEMIRREQDHCSIESVDRASVTRPAPGAPVVFDLEAYRSSRVMVHDDDPEAA